MQIICGFDAHQTLYPPRTRTSHKRRNRPLWANLGHFGRLAQALKSGSRPSALRRFVCLLSPPHGRQQVRCFALRDRHIHQQRQ